MSSYRKLVLLPLALAVALLALAELALTSERVAQARWTAYKRQYGKTYEDSHEELTRRKIFDSNRRRVEHFNGKLASSAGYTQALNHMSDWTDAELGIDTSPIAGTTPHLDGARRDSHHTQFDGIRSISQHISGVSDYTVGPDSMDWRTHPNVVSSVKDQGKCKASYAFATTGMLEGREMLKKFKNFIELSPQYLVDCCYSCHNCAGGEPILALHDVLFMNGIVSQADYPYTGAINSSCQDPKGKTMLFPKVQGTYLESGDEDTLQKVVGNIGPVAVSVHPTSNFIHYSTGVFSDPACKTSFSYLRQSLLVVGYGKDPKEGDYWLVKNSWSTNWGEKGYGRIARNKNNTCGIATVATVVVFRI